MAFSKLKALLRKAAARTIDELWSVVANCLAAFTTEECRHHFEAAGYGPGVSRICSSEASPWVYERGVDRALKLEIEKLGCERAADPDRCRPGREVTLHGQSGHDRLPEW